MRILFNKQTNKNDIFVELLVTGFYTEKNMLGHVVEGLTTTGFLSLLLFCLLLGKIWQKVHLMEKSGAPFVMNCV